MRSASGHQGEIERQWKKKKQKQKTKKKQTKKKSEQEHVWHSFIKRVTWKFLEVSRRSRAKKTEKTEMYKKSVLHVQSCFLLIRPIVVFWPFSDRSRCVTRFYIIFVWPNYKYYRELRFQG